MDAQTKTIAEATPTAHKTSSLDGACGVPGIQGCASPERGAPTLVAQKTGASRSVSKDEMRGKIFQLEAEVLKLPQLATETLHHHAPGVYMREWRIPAGAVVTGAIHKTAHLNVLAKGEISVWTEDGPKRLTAPAVIPSAPGIKRAGYTHSDVVWMTICHNPTNEQAEEKLWDLFVTNDYAAYLEHAKKQQQLLTQGGE